jgi:hypothetical protein
VEIAKSTLAMPFALVQELICFPFDQRSNMLPFQLLSISCVTKKKKKTLTISDTML